jgi:hypothetical protein
MMSKFIGGAVHRMASGVKHRQNFTFSSLLHHPLSNQIVLLFSSPFLTLFLPAKVNSGTFRRKKRDFYHYRDRFLIPRSPIPNSDYSLQIPERHIRINVFIGMRASKSLWSVRKPILSPLVQGSLVSGDCSGNPCHFMSTSCCPYSLGFIQLDYHFLCRLFVGHSKLKCSLSNGLLSLSGVFLNGPLF